MLPRLAGPFIRFGVGLLFAWILLNVATSLLPPGADSHQSLVTGLPVTQSVATAAAVSARAFLYGMAAALPAAILLGVGAGRQPGSLLDRSLQAPAIALTAALPPAVVVLVTILFLEPASMNLQVAGPIALTGGMIGWLALSVRDGVAEAGASASIGRILLSSTARILQNTGNMVALLLMVELSPVRTAGLGRLISGALQQGDIQVLPSVLLPIIVAVLAAHLIGDLIAVPLLAEQPSAVNSSSGWITIGLLLCIGALAVLYLPAAERAITGGVLSWTPAADHSLAGMWSDGDLAQRLGEGLQGSFRVAGGATLIALLGGSLLGLIGGVTGAGGAAIFTPHTALPNLFLPFAAGLLLFAIFGPSTTILLLGLGLTGVPAIARPISRFVAGEAMPAMLRLLLGSLVLLIAQNLLIESMLSHLGVGIQFPLASLGGVLYEVHPYVVQSPSLLLPALLLVVMGSGLFLTGMGLIGSASPPVAQTGPSLAEEGEVPQADVVSDPDETPQIDVVPRPDEVPQADVAWVPSALETDSVNCTGAAKEAAAAAQSPEDSDPNSIPADAGVKEPESSDRPSQG